MRVKRVRILCCATFIASVFVALTSLAAEAPKVGVFDNPCEKLEPMPADIAGFLLRYQQALAANKEVPTASAEGLARYRQWQQRVLLQDFAGLCRYRSANAKLPPPRGERLVIFGDSISEGWKNLGPKFAGMEVVNRGISGQTSAQMLLRFRDDVIALQPTMVHIMAGTNDLAGNTGPTAFAFIQNNIRSMTELAMGQGIAVLLASVPPAARFDWRPGVRPAADIKTLNGWIEAYAREQGLSYIDYHAALANTEGGMKQDYSEDGVHPNAAGYAVMREVAERALKRGD